SSTGKSGRPSSSSPQRLGDWPSDVRMSERSRQWLRDELLEQLRDFIGLVALERVAGTGDNDAAGVLEEAHAGTRLGMRDAQARVGAVEDEDGRGDAGPELLGDVAAIEVGARGEVQRVVLPRHAAVDLHGAALDEAARALGAEQVIVLAQAG